jgi:hypothetical protein
MRTMMRRAAAAAALALTVGTGGSAAHADLVDTGAWLRYQEVVQTEALDEGTPGGGDNLTCDPEPVVDGRMVAPRAPVVVGEVYALVELAGHLKCATLDRNLGWWIDARVTDRYWDGGMYQPGGSVGAYQSAVAGVAAADPAGFVQYPGGHDALNTWHYAHFQAWTSTGRYVSWVSPLFYVAGV